MGASQGLELAVRVAIAADDPDEAELRALQLDGLASAAGTATLLATSSLARGLIEASRGERLVAENQLEGAVAQYQRGGASIHAARARVELGTVLLEAGKRRRAERELRLAHEALSRAGADCLRRLAEGLLERVEQDAAGSPTRTGPLTMRELEVLRLAAQGLSDADIAQSLVLSEHTVHRHIANIRRKLGQRTRTAAVARAAQDGLI